MRAGKQRHSIEVQAVTTVPNDYGTPVETAVTIITLRAEQVTLTAEEYVRTQGAVTETTVAFRVRNPGTILTSHRVLFRGDIYNIRQLVPIENDRGLEIHCVKIGGEA